MPGVIIIGAGPGIGLSVARRFAYEGLPVRLHMQPPAAWEREVVYGGRP